MVLVKSDLEAIKKIVAETVDSRIAKTEESFKAHVDDSVTKSVTKTEVSLKKYVDASNAKLELGLKDYVEFAIEKSEQEFEAKLDVLEEKIVGRINREITDLSENIRAVMIKTDQIDNHEKRIIHIEKKLEIKAI